MILGIVCLISAALACGLCAAAGGFAGLAWLWKLPVFFAGGFLAQLVLLFAVLVISCLLIDPEKHRQKDATVYRWFIMGMVHLIVTLLPVKVQLQGKEKLPKTGRFLLVSNHLHNIDPAIFFYCFPKSQLAFVGKKETSQMPFVGKIMPKLLCPTINRENDREALKTILRCIQLLKDDTVSVAVFPEGRINDYRKLAHFRPGVFKIAQKAQVPIVVCTLRGSQHVLSRVMKLQSSRVELRVLDVLQPQQLEGRTTVDIAGQIYEMMAKDLGPENVLTPEEEENT